MASKAKHQLKSAAGRDLVTRLCSINPNGVVFLASSRIPLSTEVTLLVQTSSPSGSHEWEVQGWVVECRAARTGDGLRYRVTLLFHDLPPGLQGLLREEEPSGTSGFPPLRHAPVFGQN